MLNHHMHDSGRGTIYIQKKKKKKKRTFHQLTRANVAHYSLGQVFFKKRWQFFLGPAKVFLSRFFPPSSEWSQGKSQEMQCLAWWLWKVDKNCRDWQSTRLNLPSKVRQSTSMREDYIPFWSLQDQVTWLVKQLSRPLARQVSKREIQKSYPT